MKCCICGSEELSEARQVPGVQVDAKGKSCKARVPVATCAGCGLIRHTDLPFATEEEYATFYREQYPPTGKAYSAKDYENDRKLARLRFEEYGIREGERLLDVGSGSGAFVDECRAKGVEAWGCEIADYAYRPKNAGDWIYRRRLEEIYFPTDHFNRVVACDVLEHVLDPKGFLREIARVTQPEGRVVIEIPNFFGPDGERHWKKNEHIWYFTPENFEQLICHEGLMISEFESPTESKFAFHLVRKRERRPKILVPPGIGDSYWSIVKMESFLQREKLLLPDIYVASPRDKEFDGHKRAFPFIEMFPFLHSSGITVSAQDPKSRMLWLEAYAQAGRTIFKNVLGMDYFLSYNGHLRIGKELENVDPDLACDWFPPLFVSLEQERYRLDAQGKYGRYIVFYFVFQGTYSYWTKEFPLPQVLASIKEICRRTGCTPVFAGARWDEKDKSLAQVKAAIPGAIDLVGKTDVQQLFGLLRGAQAVVGYPSGLTIMSAVLGQKTLVIWNDYYNSDFAWHAMPPETRKVTYFAANTKGLEPTYLAGEVSRILSLQRVVRVPKQKYKIPKAAPFIRTQEMGAKKPSSLTVVCILAQGSPFTIEDVRWLKESLQIHTRVPYRFLCLTNLEVPPEVCETLPLNGYAWSPKLELFKHGLIPGERILYLDLDTEIRENIDDLLLAEGDFIALSPWRRIDTRKTACASGMMSWINDGRYSFLADQFRPEQASRYRGDHEYISQSLERHGEKVAFFQKLIPGLYSYRFSCLQGKPRDARIICYHGHPRKREGNA